MLEFSINALNGVANSLKALLGASYVFITYGVGIVAVVLAIIAYQCKGRTKLLIVQSVCSAFWVLYFLMLGAFIGMAMNFFNVIRNLVFSQKEKHKWANSHAWLYVFLAIILTFCILTFNNWYDIISIVGTVILTVGNFCSSKKTILILSIIGSPMWVVYGVFAGSYVGVVSDTLNIFAIGYALYKLLKENKNELIKAPKELILASASPRRKELLKSFGFNFSVIVSDYEETLSANLSPKDLAVNFASSKAKSVFNSLKDKARAVVLGADTIVVLEGNILGKPKNEQDAVLTLKSLSNKTHSVITGYSIISSSGEVNGFIESQVTFNDLTEELILAYVKSGKPLDKAGSYGIQDGYDLVKEFVGSKNNVIGLPIELIKDKILEKLNEK